jgi:acyl-CoA thioester hydrolase
VTVPAPTVTVPAPTVTLAGRGSLPCTCALHVCLTASHGGGLTASHGGGRRVHAPTRAPHMHSGAPQEGVTASARHFVHELRVRYNECDPQGIVFNANYLLYFDVAVTELWRAAVVPWQEMVDRGVDVVVAETNIRFLAPARFDDMLALHATITRLGTSAITTEVDVVRAGELLVAGRLRQVFVDTRTWAKTSIPDWIRGGLRRFAAADAEAGEPAGEQRT